MKKSRPGMITRGDAARLVFGAGELVGPLTKTYSSAGAEEIDQGVTVASAGAGSA